MSATNWYVQEIKDLNEAKLEQRIRMMQENGFIVMRRYKQYSLVHGKPKYYAIMRRDVNG